MDPLAPRVQPDVPEQHQGYARGSDLPPTHKSSFLEQPVDHFLLIQQLIQGKSQVNPMHYKGEFTGQWCVPLRQQVIDFRQTRPSQRVFPRKAPTSPTTGADGFYRLPKLCLKKMATGKESTPLPLTLCRQAQQPWLPPRE